MTEERPFPEAIRFGEEPKTKYYNSENNIKITMIDFPRGDYKKRCWDMIMSTWQDSPDYTEEEVSQEELDRVFNELLRFKVLPNSMEHLTFTFRIEGLTHIDITHLLRHRTFSGVHAQCTGDRFLNHDGVFIPSSIENSEFAEEYKRVSEDAKKLYAKMVDSKKVSLMDARYVLTRNHRYFYYFTANLKDLMGFVNQRKCSMVQPELDNIMAEQIRNLVSSIIPEFADVCTLKCNSRCHFLNSPLERNTRLYALDETHRKAVEGTDNIYLDDDVSIYKKTRKEMGIEWSQK